MRTENWSIGRFPALLGVLATLLAVVWLAVPAALAQGGARQTSRLLFDSQTPGAATGARVEIDYVDPSDGDAKPFAVQTVIETLADGARIDTSVPEACLAADADLMSRGPAACPPASRVGGGELDLDTGAPGPGRIVENKVTMFNNKDQLILLLEQPGGSRAVSRSPIQDEGRTIRAESPPIPGGPPDGYTALKRVRLGLDLIAVESAGVRRGYITTPTRCPASGAWTNTITFNYRDGVSQVAPNSSPCVPPPKPRVHLGVPRDCVSRSFVARIRVENMPNPRFVRVRLDGRTIGSATRPRFRVRVPVASRSLQHRLSVVAGDADGRTASARAAYRHCSR